jgi:hypothetical protein
MTRVAVSGYAKHHFDTPSHKPYGGSETSGLRKFICRSLQTREHRKGKKHSPTNTMSGEAPPSKLGGIFMGGTTILTPVA